MVQRVQKVDTSHPTSPTIFARVLAWDNKIDMWGYPAL